MDQDKATAAATDAAQKKAAATDTEAQKAAAVIQQQGQQIEADRKALDGERAALTEFGEKLEKRRAKMEAAERRPKAGRGLFG